ARPYFHPLNPSNPVTLEETQELRHLLAQVESAHVLRNRGSLNPGDDPRNSVVTHRTYEPSETVELSWLRRQLGDQPYSYIVYCPGPPGEEAKRLFEEAIIVVANEPWPWPGIRVTKTEDGGWREHYRGDPRPDERVTAADSPNGTAGPAPQSKPTLLP